MAFLFEALGLRDCCSMKQCNQRAALCRGGVPRPNLVEAAASSMDSDSLYHDEEVLDVFAELVSANPSPDCVTGKRGHEHRGGDYQTKRRLDALEMSEKKAAAAAAKREAAAAVAAAKREAVGTSTP